MDKQVEKGEKLKKMEVKNDPALPPNYVSLAVLRERWLQRKQQEKEKEERQKAQVDSKSRDDAKVNPTTTKGFSRTPQNSFNRGPRFEGHHASDNQVRSRFQGNVSAGFPGVNGMPKNVNQREIPEGNYRKTVHGVEKGRMGGGKEDGYGKNLEERDCSRRQGGNMYCNAGVRGAASVFMVQEVPEIRRKEIKPMETISKSDARTVQDRDELRKNVSCNAGIERRASVFRVEAVPEIGSKEIKPVEFSRKVDGKVQDRGNVRKNMSCNCGDNEGRASVCRVDVVPEIGKQIKPVEFSRKVNGKTFQDRGNVRKNLSCNYGDNEGTASVSIVEAAPESVSKESKPAEFSRKVDCKIVQDRGNVRKNMSCNYGDNEGTESVSMVEAVPEIDSKQIKPLEFSRKVDGKTVQARGNVRKNLSCNSGDNEGTVSVFMVEAVPEIVSEEVKPVELIRKSDGKTVQDKGNVRKNLSCNSGVEGTAIASMAEAVPEIVSKEIKPAEYSRKVNGKTVQYKGNVRKNRSCNSGGNEGTMSVSIVEAVPESVSKESNPVEFIRKSNAETLHDKGNVRKNMSCNSGSNEGTASVSMVEVVPESVSNESKPAEFIRKSDGKTVKDRDNLRKNANWRVKSSGRNSEVEELPENTMKKKDLGVLIGENAPINDDDDDCVVEVLLENNEKEGALLGSGHSKGSERFGGEVGRKWIKKTKAKKPNDSKDKNTLEEIAEKGTEDEVLTGNNGSSLQKVTRGRNVQGYSHRGNNVLGTMITRNFRDLSFVERRRNFQKYPRYQAIQKPAVWVKRGEISATNVDESGNSGPSKLESTGMCEGVKEAEAEARSEDLNRSS